MSEMTSGRVYHTFYVVRSEIAASSCGDNLRSVVLFTKRLFPALFLPQ